MNTETDPKPDGAAFDDFFESLGKKAENLSGTDKDSSSVLATNGIHDLFSFSLTFGVVT